MSIALYFDPDPEFPDADLLGIGEKVYDDGRREFVNDPEIAALLPRMPANDPMATGLGPQEKALVDEFMPHVPTPMPGTTAGDMAGVPQIPTPKVEDPNAPVIDTDVPDLTPGAAPPTGSLAPPAAPAAPLAPEEQALVDQYAPPPAASQGDGLVLSQRQGRMDPVIAAQQASDLKASQQADLQAQMQARADEGRIMREANAKRLGEIEADRQARQKELDDANRKQERWEREQMETADMKIGTSLIDAAGFGAFFHVLGSALLMANGSDAGLRRIDSTINQYVQKQIGIRDSKLRILAAKLGSNKEAIAAAKGELYRIANERIETLKALTRNDVFEKQSPAVQTGIQQRQLEQLQKQQTENLGKNLEERPVAAAGPKPVDVQKYGEAAAQNAQAESDAQRALRAIGGVYEPGKIVNGVQQPGRIANRKEILDKGIPGVGRWDTFISDLGKLPIIGALPKAADNATTSRQGTEVRAALEGLVTAQAIKDNPGRAPTEGDAERAKVKLGLNTEQGVVDAIERLLQGQPEAKARNVSAFGPGVAGTYEGRQDAQGVRRSTNASPAPIQMLEPGQAREQLKGADGPTSKSDPVREVAAELQTIAGNELPPEGLKILEAQFGHETDDGKKMPKGNAFGHKAVGDEPSISAETTEGAGKEAKRVKQSFRTFENFGESVKAHVSLLKRQYPKAWEALQAGDESAFVAALKDGGQRKLPYFTADENEYLKGIQRRL